jgi:hypothetical protein
VTAGSCRLKRVTSAEIMGGVRVLTHSVPELMQRDTEGGLRVARRVARVGSPTASASAPALAAGRLALAASRLTVTAPRRTLAASLLTLAVTALTMTVRRLTLAAGRLESSAPENECPPARTVGTPVIADEEEIPREIHAATQNFTLQLLAHSSHPLTITATRAAAFPVSS